MVFESSALLGVLKLQKLKYDYDPYYPKFLPNLGQVPNTASVDWHVPGSRITPLQNF